MFTDQGRALPKLVHRLSKPCRIPAGVFVDLVEPGRKFIRNVRTQNSQADFRKEQSRTHFLTAEHITEQQ